MRRANIRSTDAVGSWKTKRRASVAGVAAELLVAGRRPGHPKAEPRHVLPVANKTDNESAATSSVLQCVLFIVCSVAEFDSRELLIVTEQSRHEIIGVSSNLVFLSSPKTFNRKTSPSIQKLQSINRLILTFTASPDTTHRIFPDMSCFKQEVAKRRQGKFQLISELAKNDS
jgi:hypothetical protein